MRGGVRWVAAALLGVGLGHGAAPDASAITATLLTDPSLVDHTPGPDLRIGTPDDAVLSDDVGILHSGPNTHGAASYALLSAGPVPVPGFNPEANDYSFVLFVDGTLEFTPDFAASTASEIVVAFTGGTLRSTAEFDHPTRGEAITTITGGSAHMNPTTGEGQVQWSGSFSQIATPLTDEVLTSAPGRGWIVLAPQLGQTGDPYIDEVVTPLLPPDTTALVVVEFTGTVQTDVECCTGFGTLGVLVAYATEALGCTALPCEGSGGGGGGGGGGCVTIDTCRARIEDALPDESEAPNPRTFRAARKLSKRFAKLEDTLARAATSADPKRGRLHAKARRQADALKTTAATLDGKGLLGVPLATLEAAIDALVALIPGA